MEAGGPRGYRLVPSDADTRKFSVKVNLHTLSGDPDLFVSQHCKYPNREEFTG